MRQNVHFSGTRFRFRASGDRHNGHQIAGSPFGRREWRRCRRCRCQRDHFLVVVAIVVERSSICRFVIRARADYLHSAAFHRRRTDRIILIGAAMRDHLAQMTELCRAAAICGHIDEHVLMGMRRIDGRRGRERLIERVDGGIVMMVAVVVIVIAVVVVD